MRYRNRQKMRYPKFLDGEAVSQLDRNINQFLDRKSDQHRAPDHTKTFSNIEFMHDVKGAFGNTCAYCESFDELGSIQNHRPPTLASDEDGTTHLRCYSWLITDWQNIYWVCKSCTEKKANKFFLEHPGRRGSVFESLERLRDTESAQFLDPCHDDPQGHIYFDFSGSAHPLSARGDTTIREIDLNRKKLVSSRRDALSYYAKTIAENVDALSLLSSRESVDLIACENRRSSRSMPYYHIGASTNALLHWYTYRKGAEVTSATLVELLLNMSDLERRDLAEEFEGDIHSPEQGFNSYQRFREEFHVDIKYSRVRRRGAKEKKNQTKKVIFDRYSAPSQESYITKINVQGFKFLKNISVSLKPSENLMDRAPCFLLLGENATGKSTFLEAIALNLIGASGTINLSSIVDQSLKPSILVHKNNSTLAGDIDKLTIEIEFSDSEKSSRLIGDCRVDSFEGTEHPSKLVIGFGPRRYFGSSKTRRFRAACYRVESLFDPLATIPNPTTWLLECDDDMFNTASRTLRELLILDDDSELIRSDNDIFIVLEGSRIKLDELSLGYKSILAMSIEIIRELLYHYDNIEHAHAAVLIDEIETHLHPKWKMRIISLLRRAFPKVQFFATTHDPLCLRGMLDGEVIVMERDNESFSARVLTDLPSVAGMRSEQILTSEFFGLGSTDPETDAQLYALNSLLQKKANDLSAEESEQLVHLKDRIETNMRLGDSPVENTYAKFLKEDLLKNPTMSIDIKDDSDLSILDELISEIDKEMKS